MSTISTILGAVLAVGTGYCVNRFEHATKKDYFLIGVEQDINRFYYDTNLLRNMLKTPINHNDNESLNNVFSIINNVTKYRYITNLKWEWFLSINTDHIRNRLENFYREMDRLLDGIKLIFNKRLILLNQKYNLLNRMSEIEPDPIQIHKSISPTELALEETTKELLNIINELISLQIGTTEIIEEIRKEYSWCRKIRYRFLKH